MKKNIRLVFLIAFGVTLVLALTFAPPKAGNGKAGRNTQEAAESKEGDDYYGCGVTEEGHCPHCDLGIKDAKCICGGHSFVEKGQAVKTCPVCKKPLEKIAARDLPKQMAQVKASRKILFYRNPMNPQITSPTPAKDPMGMDFIPVYEGETEGAPGEDVISRVKLNAEQIALAGVKTEAVTKRHLYKRIRTVGKVAFDPELAVSQEEFLTALETRQKVGQSSDPDVIKRADDLIEKSKYKLMLLGMGADEIKTLEAEGVAQMNLVLPQDKAWVYADIYEYELSWVKAGQNVLITTTAYADKKFDGVIKSISPVLDPMTRSAKARIEADNKDQLLKPEMYADVTIESMYVDSSGTQEVLSVPKDAVLDTGARKLVYVDTGEGVFIGKEVQLGPEASADANGQEQKFYPVIGGLKEGDQVVTQSNFLIDSQSQLTGGASAAYGGTLTGEEAPKPPLHQH
ncbi:MAG: efflux RND transporter periplasmic adaptor subunit [Candidatus Omnitrophota bacterium]